MIRPDRTIAAAHQKVVEAAWEGITSASRLTGVLSPPGAGKSTLVRNVAMRWAADGRPQLPVVTQTNSQADDLCADLSDECGDSGPAIGRLHGRNYVADPRLAGTQVTFSPNISDLSHCDIVVAPARKWSFVSGSWDAAIIDEVFQMRSDQLMPLGHLFRTLLVVGDPGQLNPFTTGSAELFRGRPSSPIVSAAEVLQETGHGGPWLTLPVSWRLRPEAARLVSDSFYMNGFRSGVRRGVRQIHLSEVAATPLAGRALDKAATSGWAFIELPGAHITRTDPEMVEMIAELAANIATSGFRYSDELCSQGELGSGDLAVVVAHRDQRGHLRARLDNVLMQRGLAPGSVVVDTANRLQGRQFQLVLAWHPLSGRRDATAFHLEAGRLCVMVSRHRLGCIVVARAGIRDQLESHPASEPTWVGEAPPAIDGWEANLSVIDALESCRITP